MASWREVTGVAPELAEAVQSRFDALRHKTLATLRKDGSPRISGIETSFSDGELWLGMMPGSMKALDLKRDPRLALHGQSPDPPEEHPEAWLGDGKVAGRATEVVDEAKMRELAEGRDDSFHLFRVDVVEVVLTRVGDPPDHLVIESWREGKGIRRVERR